MAQYCYGLKIDDSMVEQMHQQLDLIEGLSGLISRDIVPEVVKKKATGVSLLTAVFEEYAESEVTRVIVQFYPDAEVQDYVDAKSIVYQDFTTVVPEA